MYVEEWHFVWVGSIDIDSTFLVDVDKISVSYLWWCFNALSELPV